DMLDGGDLAKDFGRLVRYPLALNLFVDGEPLVIRVPADAGSPNGRDLAFVRRTCRDHPQQCFTRTQPLVGDAGDEIVGVAHEEPIQILLQRSDDESITRPFNPTAIDVVHVDEFDVLGILRVANRFAQTDPLFYMADVDD